MGKMQGFSMLKQVGFRRLIAALNCFKVVIHCILNLRFINIKIHTGRAREIQNAASGDKKYHPPPVKN
jgi:hypothetical protein